MASDATRRSLALVVVGAPIVGLALTVFRSGLFQPHVDSANYRVVFTSPGREWKAVPHNPQSLFLYKHAKTHLLLRGAVNQIVSDTNPTPDLDSDGIARFYIDRTHENMPEWTAEMLDSIPANNARFRIIRRAKATKEVVTAYAVKGNTTLMVSMSGNAKQIKALEDELPRFKGYLAGFRLERQAMDQ